MTIEFQHLFGSEQDSYTGLTIVDTTGTGENTENNTSTDMQQTVSTLNALGFYGNAAMISSLEGYIFEVWFEAVQAGNWGKTIDLYAGFKGSAGLGWNSGAYFEPVRTSGTGTTLSLRVIINGTPHIVGDIASNVVYRGKVHVIDSGDTKFYLDGGAYDNQLIHSSVLNFAVTAWILNCQAADTKGDGDLGTWRIHRAYVHDNGIDWDPPSDDVLDATELFVLEMA